MLVFAHVGIAVGAAQLVGTATGALRRKAASASSRVLDYRFLALGALLPDIIDKPLGLLILPGVLGTTRSIGHTVFLSLLLLVVAIVEYRRGRRLWLMSLGLGSLSHLALDEMWAAPHTLFWPALGWGFPNEGRQTLVSYSQALWKLPTERPWVVLPEVVGALIVAVMLFRLWRLHAMGRFLRTGRVSEPHPAVRPTKAV